MSLRKVTLACSLSILLTACGSSSNDTANTTPTVSAVGVSSLGLLSAATIGTTLTAEYTYKDADNDPEGETKFQWYRDGAAIDGATGKTYDLVAGDKGTKITVKVTPVASSGSNTDPVIVDSATSESSTGTASIPSNFAPKAIDVKFTGTTEVGNTLTGSYTFSDPESDQEGSSTFRWLRGDTVVATTKTYALAEADANKEIIFAVTPVTSAGASGAEVKSAAMTIRPINTAPTATEVKITGKTSEGEVLTGEYKYNDADDDAEGTSTFRWLRNDSVIIGATGKTYTLTPEDIGTNITFAVTPVTTTGATNSIEAKSGATAIPVPGQNSAPVATQVKISGIANEGETLTGTYTYSDADDDTESGTTLSWLRNDQAIPNETGSKYTLVSADVGNEIKFAVLPKASSGTTEGTSVSSEPVAVKGTILSMKCGATTEQSYTPDFVTNKVADRAWSLVDNNTPSVPVTIADIISEFNDARKNDTTVKEKLKMPEKSVWDAYSPSQKILYLVNSERCARGIMPFEGIDPRMVTTAQTWADYLSSTEQFTHGTPGDDDYYTNRITNSGANSDPNSTTQNADFLAQGENLAYFEKSYPTTPTINEPEAVAVYNWMYNDKVATSGTYGHRTFITIRGLSATNNHGSNDTEGLFGGAVKSRNSEFTHTDGNVFKKTRVDVVMHAFDPNTNYTPETGKTITPAPTLIHPSSQSDCLSGTYSADDKTCK